MSRRVQGTCGLYLYYTDNVLLLLLLVCNGADSGFGDTVEDTRCCEANRQEIGDEKDWHVQSRCTTLNKANVQTKYLVPLISFAFNLLSTSGFEALIMCPTTDHMSVDRSSESSGQTK